MGALVIRPRLATAAIAWQGEEGRAWLDALPRLVDEVAEAWGLDVGAPYEPGGQISWVAPARRRADGGAAVLKLQLPDPESDPEAAGLRTWAGHGAVRLLDHDADRRALLLERCRPGTDLLALGGTDEATIAGAMLGAHLHAAPMPAGLPALAGVMTDWADSVEALLTAAPLVDSGLERRALATMRERPSACADPVLLHGDLNPTNVLAAARSPWLAIDPKPMVGDPAYDGARLVLQPAPADGPALERRLRLVSDHLGVDGVGLVEWCLADVVQGTAAARRNRDRDVAPGLALVGLLARRLG